MNKNRITFIDNFRAFSLLGVIAIHTLSFHLSNSLTLWWWNFLQFVVVAFVFCSGFVGAHYQDDLSTLQSWLPWYKKRIGRLYIPFLVYFFIHFFLFILFPSTFSHFGMQKSVSFFIGSLLLLWGTNTNWLPLIFIELTLFLPIIFFCMKKKLLWIYLTFAFLVTSYFTLFHFSYAYYRFVMWVPWSFIFLIGIYNYLKPSFKNFITMSIVSGCVFLGSTSLLLLQHRSLIFYDNKYPPNFYYLSFGILGTLLFASLFSYLNLPNSVQRITSYVSQNSYALFFIHYIVLDFFESTLLSKLYLAEIVMVAIVSIFLFITYRKITHLKFFHLLHTIHI